MHNQIKCYHHLVHHHLHFTTKKLKHRRNKSNKNTHDTFQQTDFKKKVHYTGIKKPGEAGSSEEQGVSPKLFPSLGDGPQRKREWSYRNLGS